MASDTEIITATIPEFRRLSGISRSRIYELLDHGDLEAVKIGGRRLIVIESFRRLIERQRGGVVDRSPMKAPRHGAKAQTAGS